MKVYEFFVNGEIVGKARPRVNTRTHSAYTPIKTKAYEAFLKRQFQEKYGIITPIETPIKIEIIAIFGIPKSYSKSKREKMSTGIIKPNIKPDIDNISKIVLDAFNNIVYKDDTQIIDLKVIKEYVKDPDVTESQLYVKFISLEE